MPGTNGSKGLLGLEHVVSTFRILVAGHPWTTNRLVEALQPFGYQMDVFNDGREAQRAVSLGGWDLIIGSSDLPNLDGFIVLRTLRTSPAVAEIPFLMVTSSLDPEEEVRAFQLGADEVINETTSGVALRARVRVLLRLSTYRRRLQNEKRMLGIKVAERTRELMEITLATVAALEKATELSDPETGHHILRVATYSGMLAEELGMSQEFTEKIRLYAPLHDVGKVGVPDRILKKEGLLTPDEFEQMKRHTQYGHELLAAARADQMACNIALSHHERWDGSGYPNGLKAEKIPIEARIVAVADVFDAMVTVRRYKQAISLEVAYRTITVDMQQRFDPAVIEAFCRRYAQMVEFFQSCR